MKIKYLGLRITIGNDNIVSKQPDLIFLLFELPYSELWVRLGIGRVNATNTKSNVWDHTLIQGRVTKYCYYPCALLF